MKKFLLIFALMGLLLLGCQKKEPDESPVIVTSISVYQDLVQNIVGEACQVKSLVSGMENPHTLDLSGSKAKLIQDADLIVFNGMGLEGWADQVKSGLKRKSTPLITVADSLAGDSLLIHGDNPHIWMDPRITKSIVQVILPELQKVLPDSAQQFRARAEQFIGELDILYQDVGYKLAPLAGEQVIVQTPGLDYFFSAFDITPAAHIVDHPGTEPSARAMTKLSDQLDTGEIFAIIRLPQFSDRLPKTLSAESGVDIVEMSPLINGTPYVDTYIDLIWYNADQLSHGELSE
ncbi:MAG: metal ABC transporter substrate-binding protein [Candidatus Marinimicrobia bacterium]|nr:metal ABC transporter substrate-binding protein [Candidatus Neomarinimicrobiota bacterium]MCF7829169.1 metal ABC transporter substrate-binding protein [Candidatus Neomarinimicrobiota bacterium]MCF7881178.1 metal ABC transporter substrate-binding protein [Candidatus Neomarinimicrobiota bacterium]